MCDGTREKNGHIYIYIYIRYLLFMVASPLTVSLCSLRLPGCIVIGSSMASSDAIIPEEVAVAVNTTNVS